MAQQLQFVETINAAPKRVHELLIRDDTYRQWTEPFAEGSHFKGSWNKGDRIFFLAPSGDGMISEIAEARPGEFISIKHLGMINNGVEDFDSDLVKQWAPSFENYTFVPKATERAWLLNRMSRPNMNSSCVRFGPKHLPNSKRSAKRTRLDHNSRLA